MKEVEDIFNAIVKNDESNIHSAVESALKAKFNQAKDVRRVSVAADIYNKPIQEK
jgi:hypothetical protein|tara:strand:+ start:769 stop:933 length:165 start_codon:yes stop_codon:yes gene_type:complete